MLWLNELLNQPPARYRDLVAQTAVFTESLQGVSSVALWFEDTRLLAAALLAAWQSGAEVFLLPNVQADALAWAAQAEVFWSDQAIEGAEHVMWHDDGMDDAPHFTFRLPETGKLWLQTSGSTGAAKIIGKTCAQMCDEATAIANVLPETWQSLHAHASVSAQHLYGLTFRVFTALKMGWTIERELCRYPEDLIAQSKQPCVWLTSPTMLTHFGEQRDWARLREQVKGIISAGGALPDATAQLFAQQFHFPIFDVYGSSETGVMAKRFGTTNYLLFPEVQARIDDTGLHIQSPWSDGEQILADTAELHDRQLILHGRSDRIIKLADKRIALNQIEHALLQHPFVTDAHCTLHQQRVAAWLSLNDAGIDHLRQFGRTHLLASLRPFLLSKIEKVALPRYWRLTAEALPRNPQGKLRAHDVATVFAELPARPNWQLTEQSEQEWHFSGSVPLDLRYFSGHFADFPLVAGVVQVQWAMELAAQFDWGKAPIIQLENVKYQQFIRPNDVVHLHLKWDSSKHKIHFNLSVNDKTCASGRAVQAA